MEPVQAGDILISDPFLKDPNFQRTVVLICEQQPSGSFGFVLNKKYDHVVGELITELADINFPVYYGGPVQKDTVHFIHQVPNLINDGVEVTDGIFWGGDFEQVKELLLEKKIRQRDIRFFIGYSGWSEGQLEEEMKLKSWITDRATRALAFPPNPETTWKDALQQLGGEYEQMVNYPSDPQLN